MRPILILLVSILAALNSSSQVTIAKELPPQNRVKDTTKVMPAETYRAMVNDINEAFAALEQSIEVAYAKLKKELKDNIDKIHDKIKELDKQIPELVKEVNKLEQMVQRQEHQRDSLISRLTAVSRDVSISEKLLLPGRIDSITNQINQTKQNLKDINQQIDKIK
jgi:chromosome segregation ATPase